MDEQETRETTAETTDCPGEPGQQSCESDANLIETVNPVPNNDDKKCGVDCNNRGGACNEVSGDIGRERVVGGKPPAGRDRRSAHWREAKRYLFMVLGCLSYALSIHVFLVPNKIVGGGISGAATLIHLLFPGLSVGIFIILLNIPILLFGLRLKGWKFILRCLLTTACLSLFTDLFTFLPCITENPILAAMYGGILQGIGIGFFIKFEVSSGGTELLGRITYSKIPFGSIATHTAIFDGIIVLVGAICLKNPENVLYALILIFISAKVSDIIVTGVSRAKLCYIITDRAEQIADYMIRTSPRGVTLLEGKGMYTKCARGVLLTCVKPNQLSQLKASVKNLDESAFIIVSETNEVLGKGFNAM